MHYKLRLDKDFAEPVCLFFLANYILQSLSRSVRQTGRQVDSWIFIGDGNGRSDVAYLTRPQTCSQSSIPTHFWSILQTALYTYIQTVDWRSIVQCLQLVFLVWNTRNEKITTDRTLYLVSWLVQWSWYGFGAKKKPVVDWWLLCWEIICSWHRPTTDAEIYE